MNHLHFNIDIVSKIKRQYPWLKSRQIRDVRLSVLESITNKAIDSSNDLSEDDWKVVSMISDEAIKQKIAEVALKYV